MKKIINNYKNFVGTVSVLFTAFVALPVCAAAFPSNGTLSDVIEWVRVILSSLIPIIMGAAVVVFLYGVLVFIYKASAGDAEGRKAGINFMIFGIIGLAVMVSVWGLVAFVTNTFGFTSPTTYPSMFSPGQFDLHL